MYWDWSFVGEILPDLLRALRQTVLATVLGSMLALVVGLGLAFARYRGNSVSRRLASAYIYFIRGTPVLVQLYFLFFVLPDLGLLLSPMQAGVLGLGLAFAPYYAETIRGGLQTVPGGQWDAATALNFATFRMWRSVIIPQALRPVLPALANFSNSMFKVSALLFAISVDELFGTATAIGNSNFRYVEPMTIVGILYLAVSVPVSLVVGRWQHRSLGTR